MKKIIPKIYTREFLLLVCQIWGKRYKSFVGKKVNFFPRYVFEYQNEIVDAFCSLEMRKVVNDFFIEKKKEDECFLDSFFEKYEKKVYVKINKYLAKKVLNKSEVLELIKLIYDYWQAIYASIFIPADERFSTDERERFAKLRKVTEKVEYNSFELIKNSLMKIYPTFGRLVYYLTLKDLKGRITKKELTKRKNQKIYLIDGDIVRESKLEKLKNRYDFDLEHLNLKLVNNSFFGKVANKGIVKGIVKIVLKKEDIKKVGKENILVSYMTIPDFLPAMEKSLAFVTDEGGIMCHAAIVAREMGKPCVIGTKIATKVLKDGDLVEVDANQGVVKILNK